MKLEKKYEIDENFCLVFSMPEGNKPNAVWTLPMLDSQKYIAHIAYKKDVGKIPYWSSWKTLPSIPINKIFFGAPSTLIIKELKQEALEIINTENIENRFLALRIK